MTCLCAPEKSVSVEDDCGKAIIREQDSVLEVRAQIRRQIWYSKSPVNKIFKLKKKMQLHWVLKWTKFFKSILIQNFITNVLYNSTTLWNIVKIHAYVQAPAQTVVLKVFSVCYWRVAEKHSGIHRVKPIFIVIPRYHLAFSLC